MVFNKLQAQGNLKPGPSGGGHLNAGVRLRASATEPREAFGVRGIPALLLANDPTTSNARGCRALQTLREIRLHIGGLSKRTSLNANIRRDKYLSLALAAAGDWNSKIGTCLKLEVWSLNLFHSL